MIKRLALALLASASPALAQPAATPSSDATPTTVETVKPEAATLRPRLYRKGNLRLSIMCAETWATPDSGLTLTVDGAAVAPQRINGRWSFYADSPISGDDDDGVDVVDTGEVWNPTDVGYLLAPGQHHVQIEAPGCSPAAFDMAAYPDHAQHANGRLAVTDWSLMGPVGAPNGWGLVIGGWYGPVPMGPKANSIFNQTAAFDAGRTTTGTIVSFSIERRHLVLAVDDAFASGSTGGTVSGQSISGGGSTTQAFTGSAYFSNSQLRFGARLPLHDLALLAGSGIGLQWWESSATIAGSQTSGLFAPDGMDSSFYVPLWAGVTVKPACSWGFQVMGQYDVHPAATDTDGFDVMGGILFQPSDSCSEPAGVHVSPT